MELEAEYNRARVASEQKISHRLLARVALQRVHSALGRDPRLEDVRPIEDRSLKTGATVLLGTFRHALHCFVDLDEGRLVLGCLLPLSAESRNRRTLERRLRQLPKRGLADGSPLRMTVSDKSLDTWVAATLELVSSDAGAEAAVGELLTAAGEAFAALSTVRRVRRGTAPLQAEHQLSLPLPDPDADAQLNLPILTKLD